MWMSHQLGQTDFGLFLSFPLGRMKVLLSSPKVPVIELSERKDGHLFLWLKVYICSTFAPMVMSI